MNALPPHAPPKSLETAIVAEFAARTAASKAMAAAARPVLADKTPLAMPFTPALKEAFYPVVADRSDGAYLTDIDGNRYVDILMGLGTNLLGHNPPEIRAALEERLSRGIQIGPQSEIALEAAQIYSGLTGHPRVTFSTTGTEAVMTAIRLARAATGRRRVAIFTNSYHGHSDLTLFKARRLEYVRRGALMRDRLAPVHPLLKRLMLSGAVPSFPGMPSGLARDVLVLDYGNPRAIDILRRKGKTLAAVLVEPVQSRMPELQPRAFLKDLRDVTTASGSALIFDEMISGFRIAPGGAQEHFGIRADIATYGKIAGGGLPLSLIAGSARFMDRIDGGPWQFGDASKPTVPTTLFAGTHCRHPLSLTAALAMGRILQREGPALQERLNGRCSTLVDRLNTSLETQGIPVKFTAFGSFFSVNGSESRLPPQAGALLSLHLLANGVHLRPGDRGGFLSTAHGDDDIDKIHDQFLGGLTRLASGGLLPQT